MLKTTRSFGLLALKKFRVENDKVVERGDRANEIVINLSKSKKLKNEKSKILIHSGITRKLMFLTSNTKEAFNLLKLVFIKALILKHFNLEFHI